MKSLSVHELRDVAVQHGFFTPEEVVTQPHFVLANMLCAFADNHDPAEARAFFNVEGDFSISAHISSPRLVVTDEGVSCPGRGLPTLEEIEQNDANFSELLNSELERQEPFHQRARQMEKEIDQLISEGVPEAEAHERFAEEFLTIRAELDKSPIGLVERGILLDNEGNPVE